MSECWKNNRHSILIIAFALFLTCVILVGLEYLSYENTNDTVIGLKVVSIKMQQMLKLLDNLDDDQRNVSHRHLNNRKRRSSENDTLISHEVQKAIKTDCTIVSHIWRCTYQENTVSSCTHISFNDELDLVQQFDDKIVFTRHETVDGKCFIIHVNHTFKNPNATIERIKDWAYINKFEYKNETSQILKADLKLWRSSLEKDIARSKKVRRVEKRSIFAQKTTIKPTIAGNVWANYQLVDLFQRTVGGRFFPSYTQCKTYFRKSTTDQCTFHQPGHYRTWELKNKWCCDFMNTIPLKDLKKSKWSGFFTCLKYNIQDFCGFTGHDQAQSQVLQKMSARMVYAVSMFTQGHAAETGKTLLELIKKNSEAVNDAADLIYQIGGYLQRFDVEFDKISNFSKATNIAIMGMRKTHKEDLRKVLELMGVAEQKINDISTDIVDLKHDTALNSAKIKILENNVEKLISDMLRQCIFNNQRCATYNLPGEVLEVTELLRRKYVNKQIDRLTLNITEMIRQLNNTRYSDLKAYDKDKNLTTDLKDFSMKTRELQKKTTENLKTVNLELEKVNEAINMTNKILAERSKWNDTTPPPQELKKGGVSFGKLSLAGKVGIAGGIGSLGGTSISLCLSIGNCIRK